MVLKFLSDFKSVLGGAGFASVPLLASLVGIQPPWPPAIAPISSAVVFLGSLLAWEWNRKSPLHNRRRWILAAAVFCAVGLILYLYLYSRFIDTIPGTSDRFIRGYECTANAKLVYGEACPNLPADALESAEMESTELWTRGSITAVRLMLVSAWLFFSAGLIVAAASIVAGRKV